MTDLIEQFEPATSAALVERRKLRRHVGRMDTLFLMVCALVGLDTMGAVSSYGAQAITWLLVMAVAFFVPYAMLVAELGSAFPQEGGAYIWTKLAFGRPAAAVASVLYWLANPIWLGGTLAITAVATFGTFFTPLTGGAEYVFSLAFIWIAIISAVLSFRVGRWIPTVGAWVRTLVLLGFTATVVVYAVEHGVHGFGAGSFSPTWAVFIAAAPVLFFDFEGFELPSAAGDELKDARRDVPFAILRGAIGTVLLYGLPVLSILIVLPTKQISGLGGFIDAIKTVFTVYGGHVTAAGTATLTGAGKALGDVAAIAFILALLSSGSSWIMGADRGQAVAGYDGAAPRVLGIFSERFGTPMAVNVLSGITSTIFMVLAFQLTSGNSGKYFSAALSLVISTTTISYCFIFPSVIKLRRSHPEVPRPYRIPGGTFGVWVVGGLATLWALFTTIALLWPGIGTADPAASLPTGFAHQRLNFELSQFVPLAAIVLLGLAFYASGSKQRAEESSGSSGSTLLESDMVLAPRPGR